MAETIHIIRRSAAEYQQDVKDTGIFLSMIFPIYGTYQYFRLQKQAKWFKSINFSVTHVFSTVHNLGLHLFSVYIFTSLFGVLLKHGIVAESGYYFELPGVRRLLFLFYLSKYYEYVDTFLLLARGKKPIFLQKFHHCGAVIMWHLGYVFSFDGLFFASLINSGVHSLMYMYYFLTIFQSMRPCLSACKHYLTSLQIGQLAYGLVALPYYYYGIENGANRLVIVAFELYISGLLVLFTTFMVRSCLELKKAI
jgi:GNS1/SUR4 family